MGSGENSDIKNAGVVNSESLSVLPRKSRSGRQLTVFLGERNGREGSMAE